MEITFQHLKKEAGLQGFPIIGIVKPHYFRDLKEKLTKYIDEGYTFEFNKKNIEEKCDPFLTMKNCKTIIVFGLPYYKNHFKENTMARKENLFSGKLARTAWGEDYHRVFQRKMINLGEALQKINPTIRYQSYVDTGPLVDRYLASKAGLGFYGYNNLFYHDQYGSFVFYGYMLIDLEIDNPSINNPEAEIKQLHYEHLCNNCNRCIKACPGKAIEKPYRLNASRCVSGILQKKGILSDEEKAIISDGIYGCDICQEVCPYNEDIDVSLEPAFIPTNPPAFPDLIELLGLSNREFKKIYGNNASAWRGSRVLKRNALIVLGNLGNSKAIPYILPFTENANEELQEAARFAVEKIKKKIAE